MGRQNTFIKGILHQKIFYRLNLIFWIVLGCGIGVCCSYNNFVAPLVLKKNQFLNFQLDTSADYNDGYPENDASGNEFGVLSPDKFHLKGQIQSNVRS